LPLSGTISRFCASGQIFSIAAIAACTASGSMSGDRLCQPPGNRLVSTGASLKPALRMSTEQYSGGVCSIHSRRNQRSITGVASGGAAPAR
jgi:hypothetical protein